MRVHREIIKPVDIEVCVAIAEFLVGMAGLVFFKCGERVVIDKAAVDFSVIVFSANWKEMYNRCKDVMPSVITRSHALLWIRQTVFQSPGSSTI